MPEEVNSTKSNIKCFSAILRSDSGTNYCVQKFHQMIFLTLIILSISSIATATSVEFNKATELKTGTFNNTTVESGVLRIKYKYSEISKTGFYDEDIKFRLQQKMVVNASPVGAGWSSNPTDTGTNKNPPYSNKWHEQDNNGDSDKQTYYSGGNSYTPDSNDFFVTWVWPVEGSAPPWHMFQFNGWNRRIQTGGSSCTWSPCNLTDIQEPTPGEWSAFVMRVEDTKDDLTGHSIDGVAYTHPSDSSSHAYYDSGLFVENPKVREGFFTQASYTSDRISRNKIKSWTALEVDATNVSGTESNATAVFQALENGTTNVVDEQVIDLSEGLNNYSIRVSATADSRVIFNGSSNTNRTWKVDSFEVYFQPGLKINKTPTATNYSDRHRFNVSSVTKHASNDSKISACRVYIKDQNDFGSFQKLSADIVGGNHAELDTGYSGSDRLASCNASIDSSLNGVEVGEKISYYIEFEADSGYTLKTTIKTNTVPNRRPSIVTTNQDPLDNSHAFNFSAIVFDIDEGANEITSESYIKVDDVDSSLQDSDLSSPRKIGNLNQAFNSSEDYASLNASVSNTLFSEFSVNEQIEIWATFKDAAGETATTSRYTYTIPNHEPYITSDSINFRDSADSHAFSVSVNSSDPDGDTDFNSCTIYVNDQDENSYKLKGNLKISTTGNKKVSCRYKSVNSSLAGFMPGETIYTRVGFSDKYGGAVNTSIFIHDIPNRAPGKPESIEFINMEGNRTRLVDHSPEINWTNSTDAENDTITIKAFTEQSSNPDTLDNSLSFTGTGNSSFQLGKNINLIDGESYNVSLRACDEYGKCSALTNNIKFRMNQKPQIVSAGVNASSPDGGDYLKITADIDDVDTITEVNFTVWNLNSSNIVVNNSDDSGPWSSTVFNANDSTTYNWSLKTSDGYETSQASGRFKVGNQIPSISKEITKERIKGTHLFNVSAVAEDSKDDDLMNFTVKLSDGTNTATQGPLDVKRSYGGDNKASANFTVNFSEYTWMNVGESITVEITFSDDSGSTASTSDSFIVPNSRPVIDSLSLDNNPLTTENLDPSITASDLEDNVVQKEYEWYINGEAAGISSSTLDSSETEESEKWSVRVRVQDEYGKWSEWNQTDNVTIANSNPEILQEVQFEDIEGQHAFRVNATALDDNGQADINSCEVIYSNSTGTTHTSDIEVLTGYGGVNELKCEGVISVENQSWLEPNEDLNVSIRVKDDNFSTVTTTEREKTIPNRRPSISLDAPVNRSDFSSSKVDFSWNASDPEGDNLIYIFKAFNITGEKIKEKKVSSKSESFNLPDARLDWKVKVFDQYSGENLSSRVSSTRQITVDTMPPEPLKTGIDVVNSSNSVPTGEQAVTCYSRWTDYSKQWKNSSLLYNAEIYENSTSTTHDISIEDRWVNYTISNPKAGIVSCEFSVSDKIGNRNSKNLSFEVKDVTRPQISGLEQSPTEQASLDPITTVEANFTAIDNLEIANYSFKYRKEESSTWSKGNVSRNGDIITGNFTTGEEGNFIYRFTVNDTYGNTERINDTVEIRWDHDWTLSPTTYDESTALKQNLIQYQPITITNSGDFNKTFNITKIIPASSSNLKLSLNVTYTTLRPGQTLTIGLNASLEDNSSQSSEGNYNFEIKVKSNNSRSTSSKKITGDALFTLDTPYLTISSFSTPSSITKGQEKQFTYSIKNEGAEKAVNTTLSVELPNKWKLTEEYTNEKGNISIGNSKLLKFKAKPTKQAENGTKIIKITATEASRSFTENFTIAVIQERTTIVKGGTTVIAGGGETNVRNQFQQVSDKFFTKSSNFELVRGENQNFTLQFRNPTKYNLTNVSVSLEGFRSQYISIDKRKLGKLKVNQTKNITVHAAAPEFLLSEQFKLNFTIKGKGYQPTKFTKNKHFNFTLTKEVSLIIHAIPRKKAETLIQQMKTYRNNISNKNLPTEEITEHINNAETALQNKNYLKVQQHHQQSQQKYHTAKNVIQRMEQLKQKIQEADKKGSTIKQTKKLANLAEVALERGSYQSALQRLDQARQTYAVETKGEINWRYQLRKHWKKAVAALLITLTTSITAYYKLLIYRLNRKINKLRNKEQSIKEMRKQVQKQAFEQKEITIQHYKEKIEDLSEELTQVIEKQILLETRKARLHHFNKRKSLETERKRIKKIIKKTQQEYIQGEITAENLYELKMEELTQRLSEIETKMAEMDAKAKVRRKTLHGKIIEKIPVIRSGGRP